MHWLDEERARRTRGMWQRLLLHQGSDKRKKSLMRGKDRGIFYQSQPGKELLTTDRRDEIAASSHVFSLRWHRMHSCKGLCQKKVSVGLAFVVGEGVHLSFLSMASVSEEVMP